VPTGTPAPVVEKLTREIAVALDTPTMKAKLEAAGAEPSYSSSAKFSAFIADEIKRFGRIVKDIDLRAD